MEVSPSSTLGLVSQEEMHCSGENAHLRIDTHCAPRLNTKPVPIIKFTRTMEVHINQWSLTRVVEYTSN